MEKDYPFPEISESDQYDFLDINDVDEQDFPEVPPCIECGAWSKEEANHKCFRSRKDCPGSVLFQKEV